MSLLKQTQPGIICRKPICVKNVYGEQKKPKKNKNKKTINKQNN